LWGAARQVKVLESQLHDQREDYRALSVKEETRFREFTKQQEHANQLQGSFCCSPSISYHFRFFIFGIRLGESRSLQSKLEQALFQASEYEKRSAGLISDVRLLLLAGSGLDSVSLLS
jgi:hypothetical protein